MAPDVSRIRLPFPEQIDFFRNKLNLPTKRWDDILKSAHDRAFIVAGAMEADLLDDLRQAVDDAVSGGDTLQDFRNKFQSIVAKHGWTGWTGEGTPAGEAWRTKVIYNTNVSTSYAAGRWRQLHDPGLLQARPYWRYVHNDSVFHPRPLHKAWGDSGLTLPHDHPFWATHFPPNGWGCRCRVRAVTGPGKGDASAPPEGWDDPDPKTGTPAGIDQGWGYAPGANAITPLRELIDNKLLNLEAPIGAAMWENLKPVLAMERELAWWKTLDEWRADKYPRGRNFVAGALSPKTLEWLRDTGKEVPLTAEIGIRDNLPQGAKQARHDAHQNGLTEDEWRALPALLDEPGAIYFDARSGKLIFVADGIGPTKTAIEFNPHKTKRDGMNMIESAFRISAVDVAGEVKGRIWLQVE